RDARQGTPRGAGALPRIPRPRDHPAPRGDAGSRRPPLQAHSQLERLRIPGLHDGLAGDLSVLELEHSGGQYARSVGIPAGDLVGDGVVALHDVLDVVLHVPAHDVVPESPDLAPAAKDFWAAG